MKQTNITIRNNNLDIYFAEVRKSSNMSREDEARLFGRIKEGDKSAETEIFNHCAKFGIAIAKTYTSNPELLEDLIQEANIGILEAIDKYDITKGYNFISFAVYYMKLKCSLFIQDLDPVKNKKINTLMKANKFRQKFYEENERDASDYEVVEALERMGERVTSVCDIQSHSTSSIDQNVSDSEEVTMAEVGEFAASTSSLNTYEIEMEKDHTRAKVARSLSVLNPTEKYCIEMYFGLNDGLPMNPISIAKKIGKTDERVRQIVKEAIKKMHALG